VFADFWIAILILGDKSLGMLHLKFGCHQLFSDFETWFTSYV